jgi:hypothetical protein
MVSALNIVETSQFTLSYLCPRQLIDPLGDLGVNRSDSCVFKNTYFQMEFFQVIVKAVLFGTVACCAARLPSCGWTVIVYTKDILRLFPRRGHEMQMYSVTDSAISVTSGIRRTPNCVRIHRPSRNELGLRNRVETRVETPMEALPLATPNRPHRSGR